MDFFTELAKTKNKMRWTIGKYHIVNGEPRGGHNRIRGIIRNGPHKGKIVCPISAVYLFETGKYNDNSLWGDCSRWFTDNYLGPDTYLIVDAADGLDYTAYSTRQKLLAALGFAHEAQTKDPSGNLK